MRRNDMSAIIHVNNIQKTFGKVNALKDVSFNVKKGETFGLLGPSGAGKTTLIQMLTGQLKQTKGNIHIWGKEIHQLNKKNSINRLVSFRIIVVCIRGYPFMKT